MERQIHSDDLKIAWFLPRVQDLRMGFEEREAADPHGLRLFNVNAPEEFARAKPSWRQLLAMA
jgi:molybdopterin-guanine dinucleotide biosynthesis protein A